MNLAIRSASALLLFAAATAAFAVDLGRGQRLYNLHCASCHGITGIPLMPDTPNLAMREGMNQPDVVIMQSLKMGKRTKPPFFGRLNDQELLDVIQYTRTLR
ncbi:MAG: cytochrome c [Rhodocyclales bacterium]|nr:cytochrome c [Rhodocyclales bacterium]